MNASRRSFLLLSKTSANFLKTSAQRLHDVRQSASSEASMRTKLLPHAVRLTDDSQCRGAWRYDCDGAFNVYFRFENVNDDARFKVRWNGQQ
jgi:hypothetical protein